VMVDVEVVWSPHCSDSRAVYWINVFDHPHRLN
ncbi:hypothetical protein A2U01_0092799, partial [Trifolium medium]|nr:hypothetical protein [Trifolium medium]